MSSKTIYMCDVCGRDIDMGQLNFFENKTYEIGSPLAFFKENINFCESCMESYLEWFKVQRAVQVCMKVR